MASQTNQATTQTRGRPKRSHLLARKTAPSSRVGETLLLRDVPRAVEEEGRLAAKRKVLQMDEAEKEWAEEQSNCGRAVKDENGRWVPVMNEKLDWMDYSDWREALQNV
jgi:hypothetical protein